MSNTSVGAMWWVLIGWQCDEVASWVGRDPIGPSRFWRGFPIVVTPRDNLRLLTRSLPGHI